MRLLEHQSKAHHERSEYFWLLGKALYLQVLAAPKVSTTREGQDMEPLQEGDETVAMTHEF